MKRVRFSRIPLLKMPVAMLALLTFLGSSPALAQVGTPPLLPSPPPGLALAPPCTDLELPTQARVPCLGIAAIVDGLSTDGRGDIVRSAGAVLRFDFHLVQAAAVFVPDQVALSALLEDPDVVALIPDRPIHAIKKPKNPGGGKGAKGGGGSQVVPSGVQLIDAAPGALTVAGSGIGVAIIDTGLDFGHADLALAPECFGAFGGGCQDDNGHGTHVGGIVAALDNSIDAVGVAPLAKLYAVKSLDGTGSGSDSTVMAGLDWVGQNADSLTPRIRVVNMSLGRPGTLGDNPLLRESIRILTEDLDISVVVAAGNDARKEVSQMVPATYPEVMAIASTTALDGTNRCRFFSGVIQGDTASFFTTDAAFGAVTGIGVTISAPGEKREDINRGCKIKSEGILSLRLGGGTTRLSGTSMAAPHAAGVVVLMEEANGGVDLDPELAKATIRATAELIGVAPLDSPTTSYTFDGEREGIVSACNAVDALGTSCP